MGLDFITYNRNPFENVFSKCRRKPPNKGRDPNMGGRIFLPRKYCNLWKASAAHLDHLTRLPARENYIEVYD
jgi:hypothetical protein